MAISQKYRDQFMRIIFFFIATCHECMREQRWNPYQVLYGNHYKNVIFCCHRHRAGLFSSVRNLFDYSADEVEMEKIISWTRFY